MFNKLPSNSEKLLLELVQAESASQVLQAKYEGITHKEREAWQNATGKEASDITFERFLETLVQDISV